MLDLKSGEKVKRPKGNIFPQYPVSQCESKLVPALILTASGITNELRERYPEFTTVLSRSQHPLSDWIFFFVAGGSGLAIFLPECPEALHQQIRSDLVKMERELPVALDNLTIFLKEYEDMSLDLHSKIGIWVLWNIGQERPSYEESKALGPAIGRLLHKIVSDCVLTR